MSVQVEIACNVPTELSGMVERFYVLIEMLFTWVFTFVKTHHITYLRYISINVTSIKKFKASNKTTHTKVSELSSLKQNKQINKNNNKKNPIRLDLKYPRWILFTRHIIKILKGQRNVEIESMKKIYSIQILVQKKTSTHKLTK